MLETALELSARDGAGVVASTVQASGDKILLGKSMTVFFSAS